MRTMPSQQSNPLLSSAEISKVNQHLRPMEPVEIIKWAVNHSARPMLTTNFRPLSAAILHMATKIKPDIPVVWVDSGYNTPATYQFAERLIADLNLNLKTYTPSVTAARRSILHGGVPARDDAVRHESFTREVKLEPFAAAVDDLQPDLWITAIRRDQTAFRRTLDIASPAMSDVLRIASYFYCTDGDLQDYIDTNDLPDNTDYVDPTKLGSDQECGLQTLTWLNRPSISA
jgi:phosphoadenosine phosphosulfate reductase